MFKHVHILVNERSGGLNGKTCLHDVKHFLTKNNIPYLIYQTAYKKHAYLLTKQIVHAMKNRPQDLCLVIGGDGTLHEVINCLHTLSVTLPIGYIPAGTGNDFARSLYQKQHTVQLLQSILMAKSPITIPILKINQTFALNSFGIGFDAQVTHMVDKSRIKAKLNALKLGSLVYVLYTLKNLWQFKTFSVDITLNNHTTMHHNCCLTTIMNNGYFGGGILLDPAMILTDHIFSAILIKDVTFKAILRFLPKLFRAKHLQDSALTRYTAPCQLSLHVHGNHLIQIDGEAYSPKQDEHTYHISLTSQQFYIR
ncbi:MULTISPECIES: diacylglycerol kinase family protein [unclassified Granulicatella]|uniref:diacylglycerol/lipid kinase family protein n=1 Tax=unclassified Granulicatella TaxID=2630493 RepID=UPI001072EF03|nr:MULTISPECIES: YegS/Rv2252/BmrU family lipid kinase [unclassified Granulicatella]MBF0781156.1 YegS/Rv2252/BmrU family lipid kinase [Granulicatella sp. 19428wC4_WM01]TFU91670.1 YegS/Rv2252/BmrU family lipid kinase [Granulicatella sp. WM01]